MGIVPLWVDQPIVELGSRQRGHLIHNLLKARSGAMAIEYGLLIGTIGIGLVVGMSAFGNAMTNLYRVVHKGSSKAND